MEKHNASHPAPGAQASGRRAEAMVADLFRRAGWTVQEEAHERSPRHAGRLVPDLVVERDGISYAIEVKAASEGRRDRLVALWAQAHLQAAHWAGNGKQMPLAIVAAPYVPSSVAGHVEQFAADYAPGAAIGVIDFSGFSLFRGPGLDGLDAAPPMSRSPGSIRPKRVGVAALFTDLNQWMLKVLLAPELPEHLLSAPRGRYHNASHLASAAQVSVMSASRFLRQLERQGHLDKSGSQMRLVRREELFEHWKASAARRAEELPMRFLLPADPRAELKQLFRDSSRAERGCLGLFAAADSLHLGVVAGVPPHAYVPHLGGPASPPWKNLVPAAPGEMPDLILRKPSAPDSVFGGAVNARGLPVSDVLQIWLDVSSHPSRGEEQADLIRRRILDPVIRGNGQG